MHYHSVWLRKQPGYHAARKRPDRVFYNRARSRAMAVLALNHPAEYQRIFELQMAQVKAEAAQIEAVTGNPHARLKPGPLGLTDTVLDRLETHGRVPDL